MLKVDIGLFVIFCGISNIIATPGLKIRTSKKAIEYGKPIILSNFF